MKDIKEAVTIMQPCTGLVLQLSDCSKAAADLEPEGIRALSYMGMEPCRLQRICDSVNALLTLQGKHYRAMPNFEGMKLCKYYVPLPVSKGAMGGRVRKASEDAGLSVLQLAYKLNVVPAWLEAVERGDAIIPPDILWKVAFATGKPYAWFGEDGP